MLRRLAGILCTTSTAMFVLVGCGGGSFESAPVDTDAGSDVGTEGGEDVVAEGGDVGSETSTGELHIAPPMHTFANVPPHTSSAPFPFVVTNTGEETTGAISATTGNSAFQVVNNGCDGPLAANQTCTIEVAFAAGDEPVVESSLSVSASPGGEASASLRGELASIIQEGIAIEPGVFDFGPVSPGSTETADFDIRNTGSSPLSAIDVRLDFTGTPVFQVLTNGCDAGLQPNDSCVVTVRYTPVVSEPGLKTANLVAEAGSSTGTGLLRGHTPDLFVRPNGDDNASGLTMATGFATITHALDVAEPGWAVHLAQGTYSDAEEFPLVIDDVRVFGENLSRIVAPPNSPAHIIELLGEYPELHDVEINAEQGSSDPNPAVIVARPLMWASIGGVRMIMGSNWTGLETDVVQPATIEAFGLQVECNDTSGMTRAIAVFGAAQALFDTVTVSTCRLGLTVDGTTATVLRNSSFLGIHTDAIRVSSQNADVDLGIWNLNEASSESGYNTFQGSSSTFTALNVEVPIRVHAHGNTWLPNVQGTDSEGHIQGGQQAHGPLAPSGGASNFRLLNQETFIDF